MFRLCLKRLSTVNVQHSAVLARLSSLTTAAQMPCSSQEGATRIRTALAAIKEYPLEQAVVTESVKCLHLYDTDDFCTAAMVPHIPLLVDTLRTHSNTAAIRERCCRCIANIAGLSGEPEGHDVSSYAALLRKQGAVGYVVNVLARCIESPNQTEHPAAKAWACTALLNLALRDDEAAYEAANARADVHCAAVLKSIAEPYDTLSPADYAAVDSAAGVIARLLSLSAAPEGEQEASEGTRAESVSYAIITAVSSAMITLKTAERYPDIDHKLWESTRSIVTATDKNVPLVCKAWHAADKKSGSLIIQQWINRVGRVSTAEEVCCEKVEDSAQRREGEVLLSGLETLVEITAPSNVAASEGVRGEADNTEVQHLRPKSISASADEEDTQLDDDKEMILTTDRASPHLATVAGLATINVGKWAVGLLRAYRQSDAVALRLVTLLSNLASSVGGGDSAVVGEHGITALLGILPSGKAEHITYKNPAIQHRVFTMLWNALNHSSSTEVFRMLDGTNRVKAALNLLRIEHEKEQGEKKRTQTKISPITNSDSHLVPSDNVENGNDPIAAVRDAAMQIESDEATKLPLTQIESAINLANQLLLKLEQTVDSPRFVGDNLRKCDQ